MKQFVAIVHERHGGTPAADQLTRSSRPHRDRTSCEACNSAPRTCSTSQAIPPERKMQSLFWITLTCNAQTQEILTEVDFAFDQEVNVMLCNMALQFEMTHRHHPHRAYGTDSPAPESL